MKIDLTSPESSLFSSGVVGWRLDEEAPRLLALCREAGIPCDDLLDKPVKRQREKAAERLLLCQAFGRPVTLLHTEQGAPLIEGIDVNISISHTLQLVVLAWNEDHIIGIDAELADRLQVLKVRDKFLNDKEKQFISPDDLAAHIIAWTAKEAMIKVTRNSAVNWTDDICLEPFTVGEVETRLFAWCDGRRYTLATRVLQGHYVTLAEPCLK